MKKKKRWRQRRRGTAAAATTTKRNRKRKKEEQIKLFRAIVVLLAYIIRHPVSLQHLNTNTRTLHVNYTS